MPQLPQTTFPPRWKKRAIIWLCLFLEASPCQGRKLFRFSSWEAYMEEKLPSGEARSFQKALAGSNKPPSFAVLIHILNCGNSSILRGLPPVPQHQEPSFIPGC